MTAISDGQNESGRICNCVWLTSPCSDVDSSSPCYIIIRTYFAMEECIRRLFQVLTEIEHIIARCSIHFLTFIFKPYLRLIAKVRTITFSKTIYTKKHWRINIWSHISYTEKTDSLLTTVTS